MNITVITQDDLELYYDLTGDGSPGFRKYKDINYFNKDKDFIPKGKYRDYDNKLNVLVLLHDSSKNNKFILGRDFDTARLAYNWAISQGVFAGSYIDFNKAINKDSRELHIFLKKGIDDIGKDRYNENIIEKLPSGISTNNLKEKE